MFGAVEFMIKSVKTPNEEIPEKLSAPNLQCVCVVADEKQKQIFMRIWVFHVCIIFSKFLFFQFFVENIFVSAFYKLHFSFNRQWPIGAYSQMHLRHSLSVLMASPILYELPLKIQAFSLLEKKFRL